MAQTKHTFCRICEPNCPLVATLDDSGSVTALAPDFGHYSGGVACHKGLSYLDIHNDPDRIDRPMRRANTKSDDHAEFEPVSWDDAIADIAARILHIQETHGPNAVACYLGNPFAFNGPALVYASEFQDRLGTLMRFGANTQDGANRLAANAAVYGSPEAIVIPDVHNTDYLLCIGANPKVSRWTGMSMPNDWDVVKRIVRRGGKVRFVNPRVIESSSVETGPTILIRPGTDVYFLAALLSEVHRLGRIDTDLVAAHGRNFSGLLEFVDRYPPERVAGVTGIPAETIREVAAELVAAPSAAVYAATGVNQSRQGLLCSWLVEMLSLATGNLGRKGGTYKPGGLADHFTPVKGVQTVETSIGSFELPDPVGIADIPGALLPDLIESGDVRALIVFGGNPLLSAGGGDAAQKAYGKLDLLVSIDIFRSATGELSDYILPGADWLERADINLISLGVQPLPYVQHTEAVVPAKAERRNEWWILARLAQAMGLPSPLDEQPDATDGSVMIEQMLAAAGITVADLAKAPSRTLPLADKPYASLFERIVQHPDGKIDCFPAAFVSAGLIDRCEALFQEMAQQDESTLYLISLRTPYIHNSWFNNSPRFRKGKNAENPLHMTHADATARGLVAGDKIRVSTAFGEVETRVLIDDDLRPGAVAMSHGFGQGGSHGLKVAQRNAGANCNSLMPVGEGTYEPISHMSWLSGVPVQVARC